MITDRRSVRQLREKRMLQNLHHKRPILKVLLQTLRNEIVVILRPIRRPIQRRRRIAHNLEHRARRMHIQKRSRPIAQLNRRNAQRPHINATPVIPRIRHLLIPDVFVLVAILLLLVLDTLLASLPAARRVEHLRRHPARRPNARAAAAHRRANVGRQPEVAQLDFALGGQHNVGAAHIAMNEVVLVQMHQRLARFAQNKGDMLLGAFAIHRVQPIDQLEGGAAGAKLPDGTFDMVRIGIRWNKSLPILQCFFWQHASDEHSISI